MKKDKNGYYRETGVVDGVRYDIRSKDKADLRAKVAAKVAEIRSGTKLVRDAITVKDWGARWVETYNSNLRKRTRDLLSGRLRNHIYPHIGDIEVRKVRPINCQECLNAAAGMAEDTIHKIELALKGLFADARSNGLCKSNPAADISSPLASDTTAAHRSITERERTILLETAKTHPAGAWVLLLLYTGLRPGESIVLTYADIAGSRVRVNKTYDRETRSTKPPKSSAGNRYVSIIPALAEVLPRDGELDALLFVNRLKKPLDEKSMSRMWKSFRNAMAVTEQKLVEQKKIAKFAEALPPMVPYDLRHTFCTDLERAGVALNIAAKLMGHASITLTAKIYTHTQDDMIDQAGQLLGQLVAPTVTPTNKPQKHVKTEEIVHDDPPRIGLAKQA